MRTDHLDGKYIDIEGGDVMKATYNYGGEAQGWFPVDSVSFGFQGRDNSKTGGKGDAAGKGGAKQAPPARSAPAAAATTGSAAKSEEEPHTVSVSRFVDRATVDLMNFAMMDRKAGKGDEERDLRKIDIHFIHSVHVSGQSTGTGADQYIYPYLMIALDRVLVKGWSISAQGDDRPSESLELWFDRSAMWYHRTTDGKNWTPSVPKGWDQHEDEPWLPGGEFKYFTKPPT